MKKLLLIAAIGLMSFTTQEPKTYTITLTAEETQIVFAALGELPAKTTEGIRAKIAQQVASMAKAYPNASAGVVLGLTKAGATPYSPLISRDGIYLSV